jgi:hypothetical protein
MLDECGQPDRTSDFHCNKKARCMHLGEPAPQICGCGFVFYSVINPVVIVIKRPRSHAYSANVHVDVTHPIIKLTVGPSTLNRGDSRIWRKETKSYQSGYGRRQLRRVH